MARKAKEIRCEEVVKERLRRIASSQAAERRLVRRARMILGCLEGKRIKDLAAELGEQPDVIIKWRGRFERYGVDGLRDVNGNEKLYQIWRRKSVPPG